MKQINRAPDPLTKKRCRHHLKKNYADLPRFTSEEGKAAVEAAAHLLIRFAVEATSIATIERGRGRKPNKFPNFLVLNPDIHDRMERLNRKGELMWPKYEPMVCPPRPWTGAFKGGFVGKLGERTMLLRTDSRSYLEDIHNNYIPAMGYLLRALTPFKKPPGASTSW